MCDEVEQVEPTDYGISEQWVRMTDEPEIRGVSAYTGNRVPGWVVGIRVQEFYRQEQLGVELRQHIKTALRGVPGVTDVGEHDNEKWYVTGASSGEALVRTAASVVDDLADRLRAGE